MKRSLDVLDGYDAETITLAPDGWPPTVATLVRYRSPPAEPLGAVLYLHGHNDYFFQAEYGARFAAAGLAFYALDLRRCGRSLRPGQLQAYTDDLSSYREEIDAAIRRIRGRDGHRRLLLFGHSTGGLIATVYAADRAAVGEVDALLLDAPFFAFRASRRERLLLGALVPLAAHLRPTNILPRQVRPFFSWSLHRRYGRGGRWSYDEAWKRPGDLPHRLGWLAAVARAHERVEGGLDLPMPILTLHSARSGGGEDWNPTYLNSDVVLDVDTMARLGRELGPRAWSEAVEGALHDVFLSPEPAAERAWAIAMAWIDRLGWGT